MDLPDYVDFISAENDSAKIIRNLEGSHASWEHLVAVAQKILNEIQNELWRLGDSFDPSYFYLSENNAPLIAAARILDAASENESDEAVRTNLSLLAGAAFALYGNFPSAQVMMRRSLDTTERLSKRILLAMACFSPRVLKTVMDMIESRDPVYRACEALQNYLENGGPIVIGDIDSLIIEEMKKSETILENVLLGFARLCLIHIKTLSTKAALSQNPEISDATISRLIHANLLTLLPPQHSVFCVSNFLSDHSNALISLPTSTGKTLIGEMAIAAALNDGPGLAIYLAPYIAIGQQAARALKLHLPSQYNIHKLIGGLVSESGIYPSMRREVIVATPERLDALSRRRDIYENLRIVIVDEAHIIANGQRGVRLESLLTRLRLQQKNGRRFRIVSLSAVMEDSGDFRNWLGVPDSLFLENDWRPTARRVALWQKNQNLSWLFAGDELKPEGASSSTILGKKSLAWPQTMRPAYRFGGRNNQKPNLFENISVLCKEMFSDKSEPVLCVCMTRGSSRGIAYALCNHFEELDSLPDALNSIIEKIEAEAPHLLSLVKCLRHGVAYHNASIPLGIRELVEKAIEEKLLNVVCSTTTLAEGVDLPFRYTIISEWLTWRLDLADKEKPMEPLMFRNIAGRSGRAGIFTEGDTIIFENMLGPEKFVSNQNRFRALMSILKNPEAVKSALEEDVLDEEKQNRREVVSSNFLAAVHENPFDEDLVDVYSRHLLAHTQPDGREVKTLVKGIYDELLDDTEAPFAVSASPIHLTDLGLAANMSLFSPSSCRRIIALLSQIQEPKGFEEMAAFLLSNLGDLPEQNDPKWKKTMERNQASFMVRKNDVLSLIVGWRLGVPIIELFASLPKVLGSTVSDEFLEWEQGKINSELWAARFDKFSDFISGVFEEFLPWLFQGCDFLWPFSGPIIQIDWQDFISVTEETITYRRTNQLADTSD